MRHVRIGRLTLGLRVTKRRIPVGYSYHVSPWATWRSNKLVDGFDA